MEKIKELWHNFKIWFCRAEVDYFQKETNRAKQVAEEAMAQSRIYIGRLDAMNKADTEAFNRFQKQFDALKEEKKQLMFLDPEKIVTTEVITVDEIGRPVQKKVLLIGGRQLSTDETKILQEEARFIKRTMWWDLVQNTVVNTAKLKMFERSENFDDMRSGKGILYAADIYRKILDRILE